MKDGDGEKNIIREKQWIRQWNQMVRVTDETEIGMIPGIKDWR